MNSINSQNRISFTSRNHPISTHVFHSAKGDITISEAKRDEIEEVIRFAWNTALNSHKWLADQNNALHAKDNEAKIKKNTENYFRDVIPQPDGNSTVLVARNKDKKIIGTATMQVFPSSIDSKVGELYKFYIEKQFRGLGIGKEMNQTLLTSVKGHYTDVFVSAANESVDFYRKLGYTVANKANIGRSAMENFLQRLRGANLCTVHSFNIDANNPVEKRLKKGLGEK